MAVSQSISLTQASQNIANNTSTVTFKWTSTQNNESHNDNTRTAYYYVSINGGAETAYSVSYTLPKLSTKTIVDTTFTVPHNNDGTGRISVRTWMDTRISAGVVEKSQSLTLTTIPRASKINSFDGTDLAGNFNVSYTSYSSSFTNKLRISIPNVIELEKFNYTSGTSFKLSESTLNYLYTYTANSSKVQLGAVIETYNGNTKIGESVELIHDCYVPSNIKPKLGEVKLEIEKITTKDSVSRNILVKGKNKVKISVSGAEPGTGSSIKSYTYQVLSGSTVIINTGPITSSSATLGPFSQTGKLKFKVIVVDNRKRSVNNEGYEKECECYNYEQPYFESFNAYRTDAEGNADMNGTYLKCTYEHVYSSVNNTNSATVTIHYNNNTSTSTMDPINLGNNTTTYKVYLTIDDNYGGTNKTSTITIFGESRILNITSDGTGIAIGKMAESKESFECRWPAKFNGNVTVGSSSQYEAPTGGISVHDIRHAEVTPDSLGDQNVNFYFDQIGDRWMSIMHMKGWSGDTNAAWELAGNAHSTSSDDTLKYRQGIGTWGDWQTVITNKNINNYTGNLSYLPLSGGTLKGALSLPNQYFYVDNKYGLNCNNSDVVNVNGIYFCDTTDMAGEGINFVGTTNGKWDTLYTEGGKLRFHPDRALSSGFDGQILYTSSNFRCGKCTLSTTSEKTVTFSSAFGGTPTVMLTPLTASGGVIAGKLRSVSNTGFTAIIGGGDSISAEFLYFAIL